jgi:hypothetical protein
MPLRAVRSISDPVFDGLFALISALPKLAFQYLAPKLASACAHLPSPAFQICTGVFASAESTFTLSNATAPAETFAPFLSNSSLVSNVTALAPAASATSRPVAATLFKGALESIAHHWTRMAFDEDPLHRGLCVALGYATVLVSGAWYLKSTDNEYSRSVNRAIREGIKQQLTLLKVCLFVFVEVRYCV